MAQEPRAPWSRWDLPELAFIPVTQSGGFLRDPRISNTFTNEFAPEMYRPMIRDDPHILMPYAGANTQPLRTATLLAKENNQFDPMFYNCIYGIPNELPQMIEQCHMDVDCCEMTCCESGWRLKYGSALALLFLFCAVVALASLIYLAFWLSNRIWHKSHRSQQRQYLINDANNENANTLSSVVQVQSPNKFSTFRPITIAASELRASPDHLAKTLQHFHKY